MRAAALLTALLAASPLAATASETQMTAAEFEAYATGKTLTYSVGGEIFGAEQYLPGRKVIWAFAGDECTKGYWYEDAGLICFVYELEGTPQCWSFYETDKGLLARFFGEGPGNELSEVDQSPTPLLCSGPDVGV